ncbi:MAG TPA: transcription termination/antitermination NusG family protein, partial [Lacipirellulaceae bacterium]|nr:transcription termination/antitermination NusG family protein [Lacipirellulaceae bacterium]
MTDEERANVADDAVSNRSDDTALEEANGHNAAADERAASHGESQAPALHRGAESEEVSSVSAEDELVEEAEAAEAEEEAVEEAEPEEDENSPAAIARRKPVELASEEPEDIRMDWYILKVQSNRERTIAEALERKMRIEGYDRYFDQVVVPTEKVTEFKGGKKKVVERKLYPGYIVVHMHINDDTWFAVRETSGVGDFTGAGGKPTPMLASEVARIIQADEEETSESPKLDIKFATGEKIKVKEGNF